MYPKIDIDAIRAQVHSLMGDRRFDDPDGYREAVDSIYFQALRAIDDKAEEDARIACQRAVGDAQLGFDLADIQEYNSDYQLNFALQNDFARVNVSPGDYGDDKPRIAGLCAFFRRYFITSTVDEGKFRVC